MFDLMHCLANSLFFDIPFLYYYTILNSSIICYLFSGDILLSFGASDSSLASLFCKPVDFFETLVILSAISLPIKSPVSSAAFWIAFFEAVFIASVVYFFGAITTFLTIFMA